MIKVRFNDIGEFTRELGMDPPSDKILRVTILYRTDPQFPFIRHISVIAGFVRRKTLGGFELIEFREYWGQDTDHAPHTAVQRARARCTEIEEFAREHEVESRSGRFELADLPE